MTEQTHQNQSYSHWSLSSFNPKNQREVAVNSDQDYWTRPCPTLSSPLLILRHHHHHLALHHHLVLDGAGHGNEGK